MPSEREEEMNRDMEDCLRHLQSRNYSRRQIEKIDCTIKRLIIYLREAHQICNWREATENHLKGFIEYSLREHRGQKGEGVKTGTALGWTLCVQSFFGWMIKQGRLLYNPAQRLERPKAERGEPCVLSEEEIERLIEAPDVEEAVGLRDRAIMEMLYGTGIRSGEAYKLDLYDVETGSERLTVREGKGRKDRILPLTEQVCYWLNRYITEARPQLIRANKPPTQALWISRHGFRLAQEMIGYNVGKYAKQAGLKATPHTFRHSFATHLLRRGANIQEIKKLLGHDNLDTTQLYVQVEIEDLKRVIGRR
jgi:integrase/recombinase XerD